MTRWWLSFANDTGCLGCVVVRARSPRDAIFEADRLGLIPEAKGGEILTLPMPRDEQLDVPENQFMTVAFVEEHGFGGMKPKSMGLADIERIGSAIQRKNEAS